MPLDKELVEISITTGLSQKFDQRLAPNGVSITAKNLVKNKKDTLQKRLGYKALSFGQNPETGLNLGTHLDKLVKFSATTFPGNLQTLNTIQAYSDNTSLLSEQAIVPEVLATNKKYTASTDSAAYETDCATFGDYIYTVWTQSPTPTNAPPANVQLWYSVMEASTGNIVVSNQLVNNGYCIMPRVFTVGIYVVLTYITNGNSAAPELVGQYWQGSNPQGGLANAVNIAQARVYDADAVAGDNNNFALAFQAGKGGSRWSSNAFAGGALKMASVSLPSFTVNAVSVSDFTLGATYPVSSCAVYCDTATNLLACSYAYATNTTQYAIPPFDLHIGASVASGWPSALTVNPVGNTIKTFASGTQPPYPPQAIGLCSLGVISNGNGGTSQSWGIWWGQPGTNIAGNSYFSAQTWYGNGASGGGLYGGNPYTANPIQAAYPITWFNSFYISSGVPTTTGGGNMPRSTVGVSPVSRPVIINKVPYIMLYVPSSLQGSYYLCAADFYANPEDAGYFPHRPVATVAPRQALLYSLGFVAYPSGLIGSSTTLTHIPAVSTLKYSTRVASVMTTPILQKATPTIYGFEFASSHLYRNKMHGGGLICGAGIPFAYDGVRANEISYCYYPEITPTISWSNGTPGVTNPTPVDAPIDTNGIVFASGTDQVNFIATYEWTDAQGQRHISARSPALQITGAVAAGAAGLNPTSPGSYPLKVDLGLTILSLGLGYKVLPTSGSVNSPERINQFDGTVTVQLYSTQVDLSIYQRLTDPLEVGASGDGLSSGSIYNSPPTNRMAFTKVAATTSPLLYGDGTDGSSGNADNFNPPSSAIIETHKSRIFLADGNLVWYSKALTPTEGPGFNELTFIFNVGDSTPITGLASMDDKLVIFKRRSIYYVAGDGPTDNAAQGDFTPPQPIPTELGCTDYRSIVTTPEGTYFYSDAGYRLLDRSLTVQYPGTAIEDELDTYPFPISACLHPSSNRMIMATVSNDSPINAGEFIYRDYVLDAWTTQVLSGIDPSIPVIACAVGLAPGVSGKEPRLYLLTVDGTLWREKDPSIDSKPYYDTWLASEGVGPDYWVPYTFATTHFRPQDMSQGFARVWRVTPLLYVYENASLITVQTNTDYGIQSNINSYNPASITLSAAHTISPQTYVKNQRCKAVQVVITDAAPTDGTTPVTGQGTAIVKIAMDIGTYPGTSRGNPKDRH